MLATHPRRWYSSPFPLPLGDTELRIPSNPNGDNCWTAESKEKWGCHVMNVDLCTNTTQISSYLQCSNHGRWDEVSLRKIYMAPVQFLGKCGVKTKKIRKIFQILMTSSWVWYTKLLCRGNDQMRSDVEVVIYLKCVWKLLLYAKSRGDLITFMFLYDNSSYRMEFQKLGWLPFLLLLLRNSCCCTYDWMKYSLDLYCSQVHLTSLENIWLL